MLVIRKYAAADALVIPERLKRSTCDKASDNRGEERKREKEAAGQFEFRAYDHSVAKRE